MSYTVKNTKEIMSEQKNSNTYLLGWLICGLGAIFYSYEYFLRISPSVMEVPLRQHYLLDAGGFGALSAIYYYAYVPMQLPVGILMDRFGPRRLLTFACIVCVVGTYLFASSDSLFIAGLGRFLVGFGSAFAFVGVLKLATIWLPPDKLGMVSGLSAALGTVGAMIGDNALGVMVTNVGWQSTINITAVVGVFLAIVLWFFLKDGADDSEASHGTTESFSHAFEDLVRILKNKQIWINGLYGCFVYLPTTVVAELWGIPYLQHAHHISHSSADLGNSLLFLGFTCGAPLMGFFSDRIHNRRRPMRIGALGAFTSMMIILYIPGLSMGMLYALLFITGLFYSAQAIVFAVARELSPDEAGGTAIATTNMVVMLGGMLLQPLVGWLLDYSDRITHPANLDLMQQAGDHTAFYATVDYQFALALVPIGIFLAYVATLFLRETHATSKTH